MKRETKLRIFLGVMILLWMGLIFAFSAETLEVSGSKSSRLTETVASIFFPQWKTYSPEKYQAQIDGLSFFLRKAAHFSEFAVLGILFGFFFSTFRFRPVLSALFAFLSGTLYAVTDEVHQIFVSGRSFAVFDILVDAAGVFTGVSIALAVLFFAAAGRHSTSEKGGEPAHS